jgi:hypothetical protein
MSEPEQTEDAIRERDEAEAAKRAIEEMIANLPPPPEAAAYEPGQAGMPGVIAAAIGKVMLAVKNVEKKGTNKFFDYKFARIEDLLFQIQPALAAHGLVITQNEATRELIHNDVMIATYEFTIGHVSGATFGPLRQSGMANIKNHKGTLDDKCLNKCHTSARKYFILGLFQVPAGDLPESDSDEGGPPIRDLLTATKAAIDICRTEVELNAWKAGFNFDVLSPADFEKAKAHWQAAVRSKRAAEAAAKARAEADAAKAVAASGFGIADDEIPF